MGFEFENIFPNTSQELSNIGFFFGAGSSLKAGYLLMPELTVKVISSLRHDEVDILDGLVSKSLNKTIDRANGNPDIEIISYIIEDALFTADANTST